MGCCSQTTAPPWWANVQSDSRELTQRRALGTELDKPAEGQWYLYTGLKHGASQHAVNGYAYYAGRLGSDRFVKIQMPHVATFEGLYGLEFSLLGASDEVMHADLMKPAYKQLDILPAGVTERLLRQNDVAKSGDIVGANPAALAQELRLDQALITKWILDMRSVVGFGNEVNMVSAQVPAGAQSARNGELRAGKVSGKVEVFDFAVIASITPRMEDALLQQEILSSSDFVAAGENLLSEILEVPVSTVVAMKDDVKHYVSDKGAPTKIRVVP